MAFPSYTYTLANSTTADASQVMQNYNDILNGVTDGTKDLNISAITVAGTATFNGSMAFGNNSSDILTFGGAIGSSIAVSTDGIYDIGSTSAGLRYMYLGDGGGDTGRFGVTALAADRNYTFPDVSGNVMVDGLLAEGSAPSTPASGFQKIYAKSTGLYVMDSSGAENEVVPGNNFLINGDFDFWQRGTSVTVANTLTAYQADRWYVKNSLGTNGVITYSRNATGSTASVYAAQVQITTAPTAAQANGCEFYQTLENFDSRKLYGKNGSFGVYLKGLNNVTSVGIQFYYKTSEAKVDTAIGSETIVTVTTAAFALGKIEGQALGTAQGTSGVLGVRIRIAGVSSGNTYDLNNGFIVSQAMFTPGFKIGAFQTRGKTAQDELAYCERFYEKSFDQASIPGQAPFLDTGAVVVTRTGSEARGPVFFKSRKRTIPSIAFYSPSTGALTKKRDVTGGADVTATASQVGESIFHESGGLGSDGNWGYFHFTADAEI